MKRSFLLALLLLCAAARSDTPFEKDFGARLWALHRHYGPLFLKFFGCPKEAAVIDDCHPQLGVIDYAEYGKARKAAMDLFDLQERK